MKRLFTLVICAFLAACASGNYIKSSATVNPPPTEAFSAFDHFDLKPVTLSREYGTNATNQNVAAKIQEYVNTQVKPVIDGWNARGKQAGRTLAIEPAIEQIRFIGTGARIFAGPFAGKSAVVMKVRYVDAASGKVVAHPEFYQHASAASGAMTFGAQDNVMLSRVVTRINEYTTRNYDAPVGGPTGMPEP